VVLLDERLAPVPAGETGDLYIGGDGLAIGYLNRPELTAERFIAHPTGAPGERLYKTGDRARFLPDGAVDFLGRLDDQIKIHGHRVELGEIENALREHSAVANAVVVVRGQGGSRVLVGYYTVRQEATAPRLPEYMVPSKLVRLDQIPLTPNGKADRGALPALSRERPALDTPLVTPRTPIEEWVTGHWRALLDIDAIGVNDRFFELGGTSILALQLLARLNREAGAELPTLLLFRAPTIAEMAAILDAEHRAVLPASVVGNEDESHTASNVMADRAAQKRTELRERRMRRRQA
jgi:hypothetical protein